MEEGKVVEARGHREPAPESAVRLDYLETRFSAGQVFPYARCRAIPPQPLPGIRRVVRGRRWPGAGYSRPRAILLWAQTLFKNI